MTVPIVELAVYEIPMVLILLIHLVLMIDHVVMIVAVSMMMIAMVRFQVRLEPQIDYLKVWIVFPIWMFEAEVEVAVVCCCYSC